MKVYRITVFLYLGFALYFLYDAYVEYQREGDYWIRLIFAAMALFLFFFRQRSIRNMEERKKKSTIIYGDKCFSNILYFSFYIIFFDSGLPLRKQGLADVRKQKRRPKNQLHPRPDYGKTKIVCGITQIWLCNMLG